MNWGLNRKSLAIKRMLKGLKGTKFNYIHVGSNGTTITDNNILVRVSLPQGVDQPTSAAIFPAELIKDVETSGDEIVRMPEGLPAKTTGSHIVPTFDAAIPKPSEQTATFTCNASYLIDLLKVATEVTDHGNNLVRLRLCRGGKVLRIDAHRGEGGQEFLGLVMGIVYKGNNIPGDIADADKKPSVVSEDIEELKLSLPVTEGRKFRE